MGQKPDQLGQTDYYEATTVDEMDADADPYLSRSTLADSSSVATARILGEPSNEFTSEGAPVNASADEGGDDDLEHNRAQIEQTRSEMSVTIDAIQERLSPANLAQEAKDVVRDATIGKAQNMVSGAQDKAQELVSNAGDSAVGLGNGIVDTIRRNPIPAALAGIGLGWLFVSGRRSNPPNSRSYGGYEQAYRPGYSADYPDSGYGNYRGTSGESYGSYRQYGTDSYGDQQENPGMTGRMSAAAGQVSDTAGQLAGHVQNTAGQVAGQVSDTAGQVVGQVQDTAGQVAHQAQYGMQRAQGGFQQLLRENPLVVGAGAVLAGLAIGLAIPETPKEHELMGPTHDHLMDQAQQVVTEKAQQVQTVAQQAVGAAKDAAQDSAQEQGLTSS